MLKQILSISDVQQLMLGDQLFDHPEPARAKTYIIENIFGGNLCVVHENGYRELKVLQTDRLPEKVWWVRDM